jgi:hypothetical protein
VQGTNGWAEIVSTISILVCSMRKVSSTLKQTPSWLCVGVCGYISRETPLVIMHTRHGCADIDLGREEVQTDKPPSVQAF